MEVEENYLKMVLYEIYYFEMAPNIVTWNILFCFKLSIRLVLLKSYAKQNIRSKWKLFENYNVWN